MQPLSGLLVLDFTTLLPGPLASLMLAEAGAEVIKIERPGGEDMRRFPPHRRRRERALRHAQSRQEKSRARSQERSRPRQAHAADRARRHPDRAVPPRRDGAARPGLRRRARAQPAADLLLDLAATARAARAPTRPGTTSTTSAIPGCSICSRGRPSAPVVPPMLVADIAGGSFPAVINILLALRARDQSGQGCHLDIAMTDAMFTFAWYALALGAATGKFPKPGELWLAGGSPRYQLYPTKDGKLVACGALEQKFWVAFTTAIGLPAEFVNDLRDPTATRDAVAKLIAARTVGRMAADLRRRRLLRDHRACRWKRRCAIRISSSADCSRTRSKARRARPCRRCRCRSRRNSATSRARRKRRSSPNRHGRACPAITPCLLKLERRGCPRQARA